MSKIIMTVPLNANIISTGNVTVNIKMVRAGSLVQGLEKVAGNGKDWMIHTLQSGVKR